MSQNPNDLPNYTHSVTVTEELTRKVAQLARLELSTSEVQVFTPQLREVLRYVEALQAVDVVGVEPMIHPLDLATPLRQDEALASPVDESGKPKVLLSAPDVLNDGYKVPPIL